MTGLPKKKLSKARRGKRAAAKGYQPPGLVKCSNCGNLKMGHKLCPSCGYYKQRLIFEPKETTKVTRANQK